MVAVDAKNVEIAKEILKRECANRSIKDKWGMTVLDIANVRRQVEMIELLGGKLEVRLPPVKIKGRSKTLKMSNRKISTIETMTTTQEGYQAESLGARPKTNQLQG